MYIGEQIVIEKCMAFSWPAGRIMQIGEKRALPSLYKIFPTQIDSDAVWRDAIFERSRLKSGEYIKSWCC